MPGGESGCANRKPGWFDMLASGTVAVHRRRGGLGARREASSSARVESGGRQGASERVRGRELAWFGPASTVKAEAMEERICVFAKRGVLAKVSKKGAEGWKGLRRART